MIMGTIGGRDATGKKMRWAESNDSKAFGRKTPHKPRNGGNVLHEFSQQTPAASATDDIDIVASDESSSLNHVDGDAQEIINGKRTSGYVKLGNFVKINFNSLTESEVRGVKRKLEKELDQIRIFRKKLETKEENSMSMLRDSKKKLKPNAGKNNEGGFGADKFPSQLHKKCSNLLGKLMKHKFGWVFNTPVDVKKLGLHDYYTIVKHPMDLGTVKTRLSNKQYKLPRDFAEDVKLTFRNAMLYNPKTQDVHVMAESLLKMFEGSWAAIEAECCVKRNHEMSYDMVSPIPKSGRVAAPSTAPTSPVPPSRSLERSESMTRPVRNHEMSYDMVSPIPKSGRVAAPSTAPSSPVPPSRSLERSESMTRPVDLKSISTNLSPQGGTPSPKKPEAKAPEISGMTFEEKQNLSLSLQTLPSDKLDGIVQIIKRRNPALIQQDDEIELDIESLDTETLWELDRFITNYKNSLIKTKGKTMPALQPTAEAYHHVEHIHSTPLAAEGPKVAEAVTSSSPVHGEREGIDASGSNSSSSSSSESGSSSSDSDSDSS